MGVEDLDHFREVGEGTGQGVEFIDYDYVDEFLTNVRQQPLQSGTLYGAAREAAIIIGGLDQPPAFAGLTLDERLARVALRMERIEVLPQSFLGRLAGVDRAAPHRRVRLLHGETPRAASGVRRTRALTSVFQ